MLLSILLWVLFVIIVSAIHYIIIEVYNRTPFYLGWFVAKGMAAILNGIMFDPKNVSEWLPILAFQITSFWVIFNPLLNKMRGLSFWHLGTDSGLIDKFFLKYHVLYKTTYVLTCVIMLYCLWKISS